MAFETDNQEALPEVNDDLDLDFFLEGIDLTDPSEKNEPESKAPTKKEKKIKKEKKAVPAEPAAPVNSKGKKKKAKKKKANPTITLIFYTFYLLMIAAFCGGIYFGLVWLNGWLKNYEAAQPTVKSQQVFEELFADPDWAALYEMAGEESTEFEGAEQFAAYMDAKIGEDSLDYIETSNGISADKKYIVRHDGEKVATFLLLGKEGTSVTDIPDWKPGEVEVFYNRQKDVRIQLNAGCTAYINDVALDDSYTVETTYTAVEKYIPLGAALNRVNVQYVDGLLVDPEVKVLDQDNNPVELTYDAETNTYVASIPSAEEAIPEDLQNLVIGAAESYAGFMINAREGQSLLNYFDGTSNSYKDILAMNSELWMNADHGHTFLEESVSQYIRYTDDLFSARVHVKMNVVCKDNTRKDYLVDTTLFFKNNGTKWLCYEMTNEEISREVREVQLTFMNGDTVLDQNFYEDNITELLTPVVSAPNGKVFSGWMRQVSSDDGTISMDLVFTPDETGKYEIPFGAKLEPMVLYPLFENVQ